MRGLDFRAGLDLQPWPTERTEAGRLWAADGTAPALRHVRHYPAVLPRGDCLAIAAETWRLLRSALTGRGGAWRHPRAVIAARRGLPFIGMPALERWSGLPLTATVDRAIRAALPGDWTLGPIRGVFVIAPELRRPRFDWHTDGGYDGYRPGAVTVWIPLSDCGAVTPTLELIDADTYLVQHDLLSAGTFAAWSPKSSRLRYEGPAGDAVAMPDWLVHRSYYPAGGPGQRRAALVFRYRPG